MPKLLKFSPSFPLPTFHIDLSWESLLAHVLHRRHFSQRNVPYSESLTHSVSYFIWKGIYWRVLPTTCGLNFHSLLPISTFLFFLSPSEHGTQYAAEIIIFCWMKFGHKSRADLLRPRHRLFPSLLSTWQFKSLITLARNPFQAGQSRPEMSTPFQHVSCTEHGSEPVQTGHLHQDLGVSSVFRDGQGIPTDTLLFQPASVPRRQFLVTISLPCLPLLP